jgi:hypothetical protein
MRCSCIFSEDDWDEVVTRCAEFQFIFDNFDKIQKEEKVKRFIKKKKFLRNYLRKFFTNFLLGLEILIMAI